MQSQVYTAVSQCHCLAALALVGQLDQKTPTNTTSKGARGVTRRGEGGGGGKGNLRVGSTLQGRSRGIHVSNRVACRFWRLAAGPTALFAGAAHYPRSCAEFSSTGDGAKALPLRTTCHQHLVVPPAFHPPPPLPCPTPSASLHIHLAHVQSLIA